MEMFTFCKRYFKKEKVRIALFTILSIMASIIGITFPLITGNFIDGLAKERTFAFVLSFCAKFAILSAFSAILGYLLGRVNTKLQLNISFKLNLDIINHVQSLPMSYFVEKDLGRLNQAINSDTNSVILFCLSFFQNSICNIITTLLLTIICFRFNPIVTVAFFALCAIYVIAYIMLRDKTYQANYSFKETQSEFFGKLYEQLQNIKFIKQSGTFDEYRERIQSPYKRFSHSVLYNQVFLSLLSGLDGSVSILIQIIVYILGAWQILKGDFSIGGFTIFISYFSNILGKIRYYFSFGKSYQEALASWNRIAKILNEDVEPTGDICLDEIEKIEIKDIVVRYGDIENKDKGCFELKVPYLSFQKGKLYLLWGRNGSGKTTLVSTLLGLNNNIVCSGSLCYNETDIRSLDLVQLRKHHLSISDQVPHLLADHLLVNLFWGVELTDEKKKYANFLMERFGIDHLIASNSVDLTVLSGGEKQKISIIRALLKSAEVLILDEPTTALDVPSQDFLFETLLTLKEGKIVIVISHDEQLKNICDKIVLFDDENGVHEQ